MPAHQRTHAHACYLIFVKEEALRTFPVCRAGALVWWRWEGVLVAFPIVSYGFTAHQYLFQIYPASQVCQVIVGCMFGEAQSLCQCAELVVSFMGCRAPCDHLHCSLCARSGPRCAR